MPMHAPGRRESRNGWSPSGRPSSRCGLPERVVDRVVERPPVRGRVRTDERRHHPRQRRGAPELRRCALDVLLRQQRGAEEPAVAVLHVVGEPVVVRAALRHRVVDVVVALDPEQLRRVEHRHVDVVGGHVVESSLRVVGSGPHLGVRGARRPWHAAQSSSLIPAVPETETMLAGDPDAVPEQPLRAVGVGLDVPDAVAVLLGCVVEHAGRVLEDVPVGVDEAQRALLHHRGLHMGSRRMGSAASVLPVDRTGERGVKGGSPRLQPRRRATARGCR